MTFIVDAAVLCGAESARNDWRWQQARMENDLILRKLSLNAPVQGRNKYEVERHTRWVRHVGQYLHKWSCFPSRRRDYMK